MIGIQWVTATKVVKILTQTFMSHGNEMIGQPVTLSGYAEWPKVAGAVIKAPLGTSGGGSRFESH